MKKAILCIFVIFLLTACNSSEKLEDEFNVWREDLGDITFTADVTVSQDDSIGQYELKCAYVGENTSVEILSPETLKGITASVSGDDTQLEYDDLILELGEMEGISPANAMPMLIAAIKSGYIEQCYLDGDYLAVQFSPQDDLTTRVWMDKNMVPCHGEFDVNGAVGLKLTITDWNME